MKRGFTILELLVASLLLGMLVTILTMIFNQSSIAWRTGVAGVAKLDRVRYNVAVVREEADNTFINGSKVYRLTGLWNENGTLRTRACDAEGESSSAGTMLNVSPSGNLQLNGTVAVGSGKMGDTGDEPTYTVNVMSAGPDKEFDTWDDIWSWPDDFE